MFCPRCRSEYREGIARCATCDVELVADAPGDDVFLSQEAMAKQLGDRELEPVLVGAYVALLQAQRLLSGERILSLIANDPDEGVGAAMHQRMYLVVPPEDLERAKQAFEKRFADLVKSEGLELVGASDGAGDGCPACGAKVPPEAEECPDCGLFVGAGG